eukprot:Opistho-2@8183
MYAGHPYLSKWIVVYRGDNPGGECASESVGAFNHRRQHEDASAADHGGSFRQHKSAFADAAVVVNHVTVELLATNHAYSPLTFAPYAPSSRASDITSLLSLDATIPHSAALVWTDDSDVDAMPGASEPFLNCTYTSGPGLPLASPGSIFVSYRVLEVIHDSLEPERWSLFRRKMTRLLAPWTTETPVFFHLTDASDAGFRFAVDQMAEVGFEMLIFSFGTSFQMENTDPAYLASLRANVEYARAKGIEVGGYDLIVLDRGHGGDNVGDEYDCIDAVTLTPTVDACLASAWWDKLNGYVFGFLNATGLSMVETDGPYGGTQCASTSHAHHAGLEDSVYQQTMLQAQMYARLRELGIFINQPDNYFYAGGSKTGMGYNENQYSLPRWQDLTISRQSIFEDTYAYIPSQGWMFVPLVDYHGGGDAAAFEPLSVHIHEYEWALAQYLGMGVAACYRGSRLYDTNATREVVTKWVAFYNKYREVLSADIIHVRRPDMRGIDCMLHADAWLEGVKGLAFAFNPTDSALTDTVVLPLYYTGIGEVAIVSEMGGAPQKYALDREFNIDLQVKLGARSFAWFTIESGDAL